jgi:hypothetical protein
LRTACRSATERSGWDASGILFGLLPTLWLWLVVAPATGKPVFNGFTPRGILMLLVSNLLIWGSILGWYCHRRLSAIQSAPEAPRRQRRIAR